MKRSAKDLALAVALIVVGVAICAAGIYIGDTDDAPGASFIAIVLMVVAIALGVRILRRKP